MTRLTFAAFIPMFAMAGRLLNLAHRRSIVNLTLSEEFGPLGLLGRVVFEQREVKNAMKRELVEKLESNVASLKEKEDVRCVILMTKVPGIFSAGADLKERREMTSEQAVENVKRLQKLFEDWSRLPMPTIAVVNGLALGGGAELALACDIRVGGPETVFAFPETRLAIIPGGGGTQRLPRLVGPAIAKELIFTGRRVGKDECLAMGLINRLSDDPENEALKIAAEICKGGPIAVRHAKRAIDDGFGHEMDAALNIESENYTKTVDTEDRLEGLRAFFEKRPPVFHNR